MSKQRRGFLFAAMVLLSLGSARCSPTAEGTPPPSASRPRQSQSLALSADGTLLAVVNPDADSLSIIDTQKRQLRREIHLGDTPRLSASGRYEPTLGPRAVDLSADGRLAYVACQEAGLLLTIDTSSGATLSALSVGPEPVGVLLHPSAAAVYVSIYQSSEVLRVPLAATGLPDGGAVTRKPTTDRPFGLALDETGATLYVTRFLLQPGLDLFDATTLARKGQGAIADVPARGDRLLAHGVARGVYGAAVRPGGSGQVWLGHLLLATDTAQPELDFESTVFPAVSIRDRSGGPVEVLSIDSRLPGPDGAFADIVSGPRALAFTPDGGLALVLDMSSEDVLVLDAEQRVGVDLVRPLPGDFPQGIVVSPDGLHAYVDERASSDVAVLAIAADWRTRSVGRVAVDGPAKSLTTVRMQTHTPHVNVTKTAIGYVRVSTFEQASEGVSLDAQRDRLRLYCKTNGIKLIDIVADEGISGSTLERPGLQTALRMLKRGRANTLLVAKLDRLSRSVRDICMLIDDYFSDERYHLLSVCGMVNTHNAAGRMLLLNLANYNQFEREMISERTRESMQHMKAQGIKLGGAPYGYEYANQVDDKRRRILAPLASEQQSIAKMAALHAAGVKFAEIARRLNTDKVPARQGGEWCGRVVSVILQREGKYTVRPHKEYAPRVPLIHDKAAAAARARELKAQALSLREIGARLRKEGLVPKRGGKWHAASVLDLLRYRDPSDRSGTAQRAKELRAEGLSLREVGVRLSIEGHAPELGGAWYPARVSSLLAVAALSAEQSSPTP